MTAEPEPAAFRLAREADRRAALMRELWRDYGPDGERLPD